MFPVFKWEKDLVFDKELHDLLCKKVRKAMACSQKYPLSTLVYVDEFTIGGKEEGKLRSKL